MMVRRSTCVVAPAAFIAACGHIGYDLDSLGSASRSGADDGGTLDDPSCPRCPVGVVLTAEIRTPLQGGTSGNVEKDKCPSDQMVIGYQGYTDTGRNPTIGRMQTVCGQAAIDPIGGYHVVVSPGATLPMRATHGDVAWTNEMCPTDQVVVGVHGLEGGAGRSVNQVAFDCAPLVVTPVGGSYAIAIGSVTTLPANGGPGGSVFNDGCGVGKVARGSEIHAINWIDAFALFCATPLVAGADGNPL